MSTIQNTTDRTMMQTTEEAQAQIWRPSRSLTPPVPTNVDLNNTITKAVATVKASGTVIVTGTPLQLLTVSATESPLIQQGGTVSEVSVSFSRNPSDTAFGSVNIWFTGYHGTSAPQLVANGTQSPITFTVDTTKETVTVTAQAVGQDGTPVDLFFCPSTTVALDGVVSAPPTPSISQTLVTIPLGYQFAFNQVTLGSTQDVIDSYRVYRSTVDSVGTAGLLRTFKHDPTASGAIVVQDTTGDGTTYYYWVSAVNTSKLESTLVDAQSGAITPGLPFDSIATASVIATGAIGSNQLDNPGFDIPAVSSGDLVAGWHSDVSSGGPILKGQVLTGSFPFSGSQCIQINIAGGSASLANGSSWTSYVIQDRVMPVVPGQIYTLTVMSQKNVSGLPSGVTVNGGVQVRQIYSDGSSDFSANLFTGNLTSLGSGWQSTIVASKTIPTPSGKTLVSLRFECIMNVTNSSGSAQTLNSSTMNAGLMFDNVSLVRVANLDNEISDGSTYARPLAGYLANGVPYTFRGAWSSATAYVVGNEVGYLGNYWVCTTNNTNSNPFVGSSNWQIQGPATLDSVSDGASYAKTAANALQGGFPKGLTPGAQMLPNPGFELNQSGGPGTVNGLGPLCDDWVVTRNDIFNVAGFTVKRETSGQAFDGNCNIVFTVNQGLQIPNNVSNACVALSTPIAVKPGTVLFYGGMGRISMNTTVPTGMGVRNRFSVEFYDSNGTFITDDFIDFNSLGAGGGNTAYTLQTKSCTAPSGTATARMGCWGIVSNFSLGSTYTFYGNTGAAPSGSNIWSDIRYDDVFMFAQVDPSTQQIAAKGSISPTFGGGITYSCSSTTTMQFSSTVNIFRTDATTTTPTYPSTVTTGLVANTKYKVFPYFDEAKNAINFVTGSETGITTSGSTGWMFADSLSGTNNQIAQQYQSLQNRVPLTATAFEVQTPASGTGGGGGGGSGNCLEENQLVETERGVMPVKEVVVGDRVRSEDGWLTVNDVRFQQYSNWVQFEFDNGERLLVSDSHPFELVDRTIKRAAAIGVGDVFITTTGVTHAVGIQYIRKTMTRVGITIDAPHTFFAGETAPVILTHNPIVGT